VCFNATMSDKDEPSDPGRVRGSRVMARRLLFDPVLTVTAAEGCSTWVAQREALELLLELDLLAIRLNANGAVYELKSVSLMGAWKREGGGM
jgi:hypothetical protein